VVVDAHAGVTCQMCGVHLQETEQAEWRKGVGMMHPSCRKELDEIEAQEAGERGTEGPRRGSCELEADKPQTAIAPELQGSELVEPYIETEIVPESDTPRFVC